METREPSISWINDFSRGSYSLFAGNVLEAFQPLDLFHFLPMWYDLWLEQIVKAYKTLNLQDKKYTEIKAILPHPSTLRALLIKIIPTYIGTKSPNIENFRIVANFFARMLLESCPKDPFAIRSNPYHSEKEVRELISKTTLEKPTLAQSSLISQLIITAGSLSNALYNDVVTDLGWETYGPYTVKKGEVLLIRYFPNLSPKELWPDKFLPKVKSLTIFTVYKNIEWKITGVGCHTVSHGGSPVQNLCRYCVAADGLVDNGDVSGLISTLGKKSADLFKMIKSLGFEDLKQKAMFQECYQLKELFDAAKMDWRPTKAMFLAIKNKKLYVNILPMGTFMKSIKQYRGAFGIDKFNNEVLNNL